jgi:aprataxin
MSEGGDQAGQVPRSAEPASPSASSPSLPRNACTRPENLLPTEQNPNYHLVTELMSKEGKSAAKPASNITARSSANTLSRFDKRDGLGSYINHPEKSNKSQVIFYNDDFVGINDLYPKSSVHCLLLPRSPRHQRMHPFEAFEDAEFLASVREHAAKLKTLVAKELQRKYAQFSEQERAREAVLNGEVELKDGEALPSGRDWEQEVRVGVHAHPSMNHLHIHVLSVDRFSEKLRHRKHYNSFSTPFFVELDAFPLSADDERRHPGRNGYLNSNLKCWRCGKDFGGRFTILKEHLAAEFEQWKKE